MGVCVWSICLFCSGIGLEGIRRLSRAYDRRLTRFIRRKGTNSISSTIRHHELHHETALTPINPLETTPFVWDASGPNSPMAGVKVDGLAVATNRSPSWPQHLVRALLHGLQYAIGFFVMIIAMETYWNSYVLLALISGAIIGHLAFGRDTSPSRHNNLDYLDK